MRSATAAAAASPHAGAIQRLRCPSLVRPGDGRASASGSAPRAAADSLRTAAWIRSSSPAGASTGKQAKGLEGLAKRRTPPQMDFHAGARRLAKATRGQIRKLVLNCRTPFAHDFHIISRSRLIP